MRDKSILGLGLIIIVGLVFVLIPKLPIILPNNQEDTLEPVALQIAPSYIEPSFIHIFVDGVSIQGGMWSVVNGIRSIDIRDYNTNNPVHSEIYCDREDVTAQNPTTGFVKILTCWGFGNRTATWTVDGASVKAVIVWDFKEPTHLDSLIDPYWDFAGSWWYDPSQNITFWDSSNEYSMSYATVPQEQFVNSLQGARLDYLPPDLTKNYRVTVHYNDGNSCYFGIDRLHGNDFYRVFKNQMWSSQFSFSYTIEITQGDGVYAP